MPSLRISIADAWSRVLTKPQRRQTFREPFHGTKARKTEYLSTLTAKKKGLESFVHPEQRIFENWTVNRTNALSHGLDVPKLVRLL